MIDPDGYRPNVAIVLIKEDRKGSKREMQQLIAQLGRPYRQRTTLYRDADAASSQRALCAAPLAKPYNAPLSRKTMRVVA